MSKTQTNPLMEVFKSLNNRGLGFFFTSSLFLFPSVLQGPRIRSRSAKIQGELPILPGSLKAMNAAILPVPQQAFSGVSACFNSLLSDRGCEHWPLPGDQCKSAMSKRLTGKTGIKHQLAGHTALLVQLTWHVREEFKSFRSALCAQIVVEIFLSR